MGSVLDLLHWGESAGDLHDTLPFLRKVLDFLQKTYRVEVGCRFWSKLAEICAARVEITEVGTECGIIMGQKPRTASGGVQPPLLITFPLRGDGVMYC